MKKFNEETVTWSSHSFHEVLDEIDVSLKRPPAQAGGFGHECRRLKSLLRLKSS